MSSTDSKEVIGFSSYLDVYSILDGHLGRAGWLCASKTDGMNKSFILSVCVRCTKVLQSFFITMIEKLINHLRAFDLRINTRSWWFGDQRVFFITSKNGSSISEFLVSGDKNCLGQYVLLYPSYTVIHTPYAHKYEIIQRFTERCFMNNPCGHYNNHTCTVNNKNMFCITEIQNGFIIFKF